MTDWEKLDEEHKKLVADKHCTPCDEPEGPFERISTGEFFDTMKQMEKALEIQAKGERRITDFLRERKDRTFSYTSLAEWEQSLEDDYFNLVRDGKSEVLESYASAYGTTPEPSDTIFGYAITDSDENGHVEVNPYPYKLVQQIPGPDGREFRVIEIEDICLRSNSSVVIMGRVTCASRSADKAAFSVGYVHTGCPREYTAAELATMAGSGPLGGPVTNNPVIGVRVQNLTKKEPEPKVNDMKQVAQLFSYSADTGVYNEMAQKELKSDPPEAVVYKGKLFIKESTSTDRLCYREVPNWEDL